MEGVGVGEGWGGGGRKREREKSTQRPKEDGVQASLAGDALGMKNEWEKGGENDGRKAKGRKIREVSMILEPCHQGPLIPPSSNDK